MFAHYNSINKVKLILTTASTQLSIILNHLKTVSGPILF